MERNHPQEIIADLKSDVKNLTATVENLLATAQLHRLLDYNAVLLAREVCGP